ncbi:MAG: hypothetical protein JWP72_1056 [Massilia sp.]|nr:hypothetical protein [Massilia sp.]
MQPNWRAFSAFSKQACGGSGVLAVCAGAIWGWLEGNAGGSGYQSWDISPAPRLTG